MIKKCTRLHRSLHVLEIVEHNESKGVAMTTESNSIIVQDMFAVDLTALAKRDLDLHYIDPDYERWDFYRDNKGNPISGRGKKFEVMIWRPELKSNETISSEQVRCHFRRLGFVGHAGAFTEWRRQNPTLMGHYASVLENDACWRRSSNGDLFVPYSDFGEGSRNLSQYWLINRWYGHWQFVAFREVK